VCADIIGELVAAAERSGYRVEQLLAEAKGSQDSEDTGVE
jgi:hypothetical protein